MRPERLELSGFTAFRRSTTIDFRDADMFVLVGPTGSGKSSVIDALTFALYGSVPRYDDARLVAPVISQGSLEAKVRLDFAVGTERYTATRVVRRTKTGATTKEARLEHHPHGDTGDTEVLAGTADEVAAAVEGLLGLGFDEFCKCVVLPQGDFARFLHDKPGRRQDLLVGLLDLRIYDEMGQRARRRAAEHEQAIKVMDDRLGRLAEATPERLATVEARLEQLERLLALVDAAQPRLLGLDAAKEELEVEAAEAERAVTDLCGLSLPSTAEGRSVGDCKAAVMAATESVKAAEQDEQAVRATLDALPPPAETEHLLDLHAELAKTRECVADCEAALAAADAEVMRVEGERREAVAESERADVTHETLLHRSLAHTLRAGLESGDTCPVCGSAVGELSADDAPPDLAAAREARDTAAAAVRRADARCQKSHVALERAKAEVEQAVRRAVEIAADLDGRPDEERLHDLASERSGTEDTLREVTARLAEARKTRDAADAELTAASTREAAAWVSFHSARDSIAHLQPPPVDRDDGVDAASAALAAWARHTAETLRSRVAEAGTEAERLAAERAELAAETDEACAAAGLTAGDRPRDACVEALAETRLLRERVSEQIEEAKRIGHDRTAVVEAAGVAAALGQLLGAKRFEKWLVEEALRRLLEGATRVLRRLTAGQYSLTRDERGDNFAVVDHRNADEARSARTLSGGETFLASLSLALALGEEIRGLAAGGGARLESLFLDEGFGTLDSETLDVVAAAIEELGAQGTVVGLVTHVRELAERIPVRYEVEAGPDGSRVERVDT